MDVGSTASGCHEEIEYHPLAVPLLLPTLTDVQLPMLAEGLGCDIRVIVLENDVAVVQDAAEVVDNRWKLNVGKLLLVADVTCVIVKLPYRYIPVEGTL